MKKSILIFLIILSIPSLAHAEKFVCFDAQLNYKSRDDGDCNSFSFCHVEENPLCSQKPCSFPNILSVDSNCIIATESEYNKASRFTEFDGNGVPDRVVTMAQSEIDAINAADAAQAEASLRTSSKAQFDGQTVTGQSLRCMAKVIIDELNVVRAWTVSFKAEVAAASNLADLKTRVATLSTLNPRTLSQAKAAMQACVDAGDVDE